VIKTALVVIFNLFFLRFKKTWPKKILLVAEYGKSGGARTYFISLLKFLKRSEFDVTILKNSQEEDKEIDYLLKSLDFKTITSYFDFWCIDMDTSNRFLSKKKMISYQLREMKFWCKLLRENSFSSILLSVSYPEQYLYAFLLPIRLKYILHTQPLKKADKYKECVLKLFLGPKKQIITVSESSKKAIEYYWMNSKKNKYVNVVYNYYEPKYKNITLNNPRDINIVLTIGAVEAYKNPFFFIECAKQILINPGDKNIEFIWSGEGTLLDECRNRVIDYPCIKFIGNQENVEKLYAHSLVYFQPSLQESHGISVLGAMYFKLACVVSDRGGLKESVQNNLSGYVVDVTKTASTVERLTTLLNNKHDRDTKGELGFQIFEKKFTREVWELNMNKLISKF
jgi:glycosyltransferase involved in cell wall biosynthesis